MEEFYENEIAPFTRAILASERRGCFSLVGSAFLVRRNDDILLITAAHVINNQNTYCQLYLDCEDEIVQKIPFNVTQIDHEKDCAVIVLPDNYYDKLKNIPILEYEKIDLGNNCSYKGYVAIGYPISKNKGNLKQRTKGTTLYSIFGVECGAETYNNIKKNRLQYLSFAFESKGVLSSVGKLRMPWGVRGMSGCPVFGITDSGLHKVVSILIEYHPDPNNAVVSTRLSEVFK